MQLANAKNLIGNYPDSLPLMTLGDLSYGKGVQGVVPGGVCEGIKAVDFDSLVREWYKSRCKKTVKSADAFYEHSHEVYLIEFKNGSCDMYTMQRKIYDSVIALVECGGWSYSRARDQITAILVHDINDVPVAKNTPDDFRSLAGYMVKECYYLTPQGLEDLARQRSWQEDNENFG